MKDHLYTLNKSNHAQALHASQAAQGMKDAAQQLNNAPRQSKAAKQQEMVSESSSSPVATTAPEDQAVRQLLEERQQRLQKLGNNEALVQQARAKLLRQASAEINAVMTELNAANRANQLVTQEDAIREVAAATREMRPLHEKLL